MGECFLTSVSTCCCFCFPSGVEDSAIGSLCIPNIPQRFHSCPNGWRSIYLFKHPSIYLPTYPSIYPFVYPSIHPSVCLPSYPFIDLPIHPSIYIYIYHTGWYCTPDTHVSDDVVLLRHVASVHMFAKKNGALSSILLFNPALTWIMARLLLFRSWWFLAYLHSIYSLLLRRVSPHLCRQHVSFLCLGNRIVFFVWKLGQHCVYPNFWETDLSEIHWFIMNPYDTCHWAG